MKHINTYIVSNFDISRNNYCPQLTLNTGYISLSKYVIEITGYDGRASKNP